MPFLIFQIKKHTLIRHHLNTLESSKNQKSISSLLIINDDTCMSSTVYAIIFFPFPSIWKYPQLLFWSSIEISFPTTIETYLIFRRYVCQSKIFSGRRVLGCLIFLNLFWVSDGHCLLHSKFLNIVQRVLMLLL